MTIAVEEEVRKILTREREEKISQAHADAWKDWWDAPTRLLYSRWPRTRATMYFERLTARLIKVFATDKAAQFVFHDETFKLVLDDKLVIRFKKASDNGLGSNISTQAVMDFCEAQADLPGLPSHQKIEIVYTLNVTHSAIAEISVQARDGNVKLWGYALGGASGAQVLPMPSRKPPSSPPPVDDLVAPRKSGRSDKSRDKKE